MVEWRLWVHLLSENNWKTVHSSANQTIWNDFTHSSWLVWCAEKPLFIIIISICFSQFSSFRVLLIGLSVCCIWLCLWLVLTFICIWHSWSVSQMSRWCVCHSTTSEFMWGWAMPSLSNSRTGSTTQIYGSEWGSIPGVWTLDIQI